MDSDKKALMKRKIEENRIKQRQIRTTEEKRRIKENIDEFDKKYRFVNDDEVKKIESFIDKLEFSYPGRIVTVDNVPVEYESYMKHENMYLCFLGGSEELLKIYIYGKYRDMIGDMDNWDCFSPFLLLIDEDFVRYIYINDDGEERESYIDRAR